MSDSEESPPLLMRSSRAAAGTERLPCKRRKGHDRHRAGDHVRSQHPPVVGEIAVNRQVHADGERDRIRRRWHIQRTPELAVTSEHREPENRDGEAERDVREHVRHVKDRWRRERGNIRRIHQQQHETRSRVPR